MSDLISKIGLTALQILVTGFIISFIMSNLSELLELFNQLIVSRIILY